MENANAVDEQWWDVSRMKRHMASHAAQILGIMAENARSSSGSRNSCRQLTLRTSFQSWHVERQLSNDLANDIVVYLLLCYLLNHA